jgi:Fe-Mn family superoxide dismutase
MRGNQYVESPMTMTTERRNFLKAVSAAAASTAVLAGTQALAQGNLQATAKAMPYQAKPMPFDPKSITGISEKVLVSHMRTTMSAL